MPLIDDRHDHWFVIHVVSLALIMKGYELRQSNIYGHTVIIWAIYHTKFSFFFFSISLLICLGSLSIALKLHQHQ